ncbi:uncharacterized protein LOC131620485 isoform X3 [Vicia villosa]|uniref:uncharacterized protein LOC131620485 isoform X3 n=1 Tax=Vicia villosa TaxID=3911 RepID=UPI00273CC52D|nr:uncharacterized protein LOC131620485 isoform X3 [Vicia villosa]
MDLGLGGSNSSPSRPKWRKVAYGGMQHGYDDNHTDDTFLEGMVMNASVVKRDMLKLKDLEKKTAKIIANISFKQSTTFMGNVGTHKDYCNSNGSMNMELKSYLVIRIVEGRVKLIQF